MFELFAALAILVVAIVAWASTRPDTFAVSRSVVIKAPPEKIFPMINDLRSFASWSPFEKKDPAATLTYSGPPSGKGAGHGWDGNRTIGKGTLEIVDSQPPSKVTIRLMMEKPMKADNTVNFTLEPNGDSTTVTWAMTGAQPLIGKIVTLFIDCDKMVGKDFEAGLASLKAHVEA